MTLYINNKAVIDNKGELILGNYSTRANLPQTNVTGYLAYVADQGEFVVNTSQSAYPNTSNSPPAPSTSSNSPDTGVTWYKILKNSQNSAGLAQPLNQGTLAAGYNGSSVWNEINLINFSTDSVTLLAQTLTWAARYTSAHSTTQYAWYHDGGDTTTGFTPPLGSAPVNTWSEPGTGFNSVVGDVNETVGGYTTKQSWSTFTTTQIASRRAHARGSYAVSFQSGSALDSQAIGVTQNNSDAGYITFATETWAYDPLYLPPTSSNYGLAATGPNFAYVNFASVYKFNWAGKAYTATGLGPPPSANGATRGGHNTTWGKFYYGYSSAVDRYNQDTDNWVTTAGNSQTMVEISTITGQNWGYWYALFNGAYTNASAKTLYATDTTFMNPASNLQYSWQSGNSASGCSGPAS